MYARAVAPLSSFGWAWLAYREHVRRINRAATQPGAPIHLPAALFLGQGDQGCSKVRVMLPAGRVDVTIPDLPQGLYRLVVTSSESRLPRFCNKGIVVQPDDERIVGYLNMVMRGFPSIGWLHHKAKRPPTAKDADWLDQGGALTLEIKVQTGVGANYSKWSPIQKFSCVMYSPAQRKESDGSHRIPRPELLPLRQATPMLQAVQFVASPVAFTTDAIFKIILEGVCRRTGR